MDGHEITELNLSSLERTKRIDAEFYKKEHVAVDKVLSSWNKKSIADCFYVSDGNHMSISDSFCEIGVPYYRGQDIYNLFIENASPLMIDRTTFDKPQMRRSHLQKGDILMSIVGAIVGNSAMVTSENPATCSCKLSIMRSKNAGIVPELLLVYIKTKYGQVQIQKFKRGAAQTGLLLEDFDQLFIPVFGKMFQNQICQLVRSIYEYTQQAVSVYEDAQQYLTKVISFNTNIYATRRGEYASLIVIKAVDWFANYVYALRNALFHEIISPLDEEWQGVFKSAYLLLKQVSDICISCIAQIEGFSQTQENAIFEYAEKYKSEYFDSLAEYVELLDFPKMVLSDWKIEKGKIILKGWFSARLKLQQGDAEDIENGTGFIREEEKGFDFSVTLGDDFKIAKDKETQKECVEIKLQGI